MNNNPLGTQFNSYELNTAINYYLLSPYQYSLNKPLYFTQTGTALDGVTYGMQYSSTYYDVLLPTDTGAKKSVNDYPSQSYNRFQSGDGEFSTTNDKLWYKEGSINGGVGLNPQETEHIILTENNRGGLNTSQFIKYSLDETNCKSIYYNNRTPFDDVNKFINF